MPIVGIDIGGSHISSAAVNEDTLTIIEGTYFKGPVDSKASKETILKGWAEIINQTLGKLNTSEVVGIAFSMPGPFEYETGIAMFEGNDKYESLYNVNVPEELGKYLNSQNVSFKFLNDATCFGIGSALLQKDGGRNKKIIAITLGTGFGASFLNDIVPVTKDDNVPENGCLWDKPFKESIADNYFSTRWFLNAYEQYSGQKINDGVKEIAGIKNEHSANVFNEFAANLSSFLLPHISRFSAASLVLGGNIAKCHPLFLPKILENFKENEVDIIVDVIENTEEASIIGASYVYNEVFWQKIKQALPSL
ncbi:ROK family protein [Flavobacterium zepuense]|uniref:ROK family protein n=1 Tax=Flavobacterium zepuense TaxID=2593302 RepID=A0A552V4C3_9FLAO|nr:ROK family protein [Flavobacterium zepuense]TRW25335.1 ROK family protein [Flavobacterium zepuense]